MSRRALAAALAPALAAALAGCLEEVDPAGLPSIDGYRTWWSAPPLVGFIPGHGESYRVIYVNDVARTYPHAGRYPIGSVIVKEIHDVAGDDGQGELRYLAIMRKVGEPGELGALDVDAPVDRGWVFTEKRGTGADVPERHRGSCWSACHRQAAYDGVWLDYGE